MVKTEFNDPIYKEKYDNHLTPMCCDDIFEGKPLSISYLRFKEWIGELDGVLSAVTLVKYCAMYLLDIERWFAVSRDSNGKYQPDHQCIVDCIDGMIQKYSAELK